MYFSINGQDFSHLVNSLKVGFETLVSDDSGRNAAGDTVLDVINKKIKVYVGLRHTTDAEMSAFMTAISGFVVNVSYLDPQTRALSSIQAYTGTPNPEYYTIQQGHTIFKPMSLNFIEL